MLTSATSRNLALRRGVLVGAEQYTFRLYATYGAVAALNNPASCMSCGYPAPIRAALLLCDVYSRKRFRCQMG